MSISRWMDKKAVVQIHYGIFSSVQFSRSVVSDSATPWIAARQASLSITNPGVHSDLLPSSQWCHPAISSSIVLFSSYPQFFPTSEYFQVSQLFASGGQSIGVSINFNISPSNEHPGLISFRMDWLDLLALQGTSRLFSNTTVQKYQFFSAQLSL